MGNKLLPTKVKALAATEIPIPFAELNTPNIEDLDALVEQVQRTLLKPEVAAHWLSRLAGLARYEMLALWGIVWGVLTVASSVSGLFELSKPLSWMVENWTDALLLFWRLVFLLQFQLGPFDAMFLTIVALITGNVVASLARGVSPELTKRTQTWQRVSLCVSLAAVLWVSTVGVEVGVRKYLERSERAAVVAFKGLFPTDPICAGLAAIVSKSLVEATHDRVPDLSSRMASLRGVRECAEKNGIPESQLMQQFEDIAQGLYAKGRNHIDRLLGYGPAFALQALLPFLIYWCSRLFTKRRINVSRLAKRLWLVLACVASIFLLNSGLLALERVDWRALLDRP